MELVRSMAAGILKTLAVWVERKIASGEIPACQKAACVVGEHLCSSGPCAHWLLAVLLS